MKNAQPDRLSRSYYSFRRYNSKQRMLTYWHQISIVSECQPSSVLEVGVGTGLVTSYLRHSGIPVTTLDINSRLKPDYVGSILCPPDELNSNIFDLVLCSRVLHHINFDEFELAVSNLFKLTRKYCLLSLPVDDFRFYFMTRVTSSSISTLTIPLPIFLKRTLIRLRGRGGRSGLWQISSSTETSEKHVIDKVSRYFQVIKKFRIPEDQSHLMLVLQKVETQPAAQQSSSVDHGGVDHA